MKNSQQRHSREQTLRNNETITATAAAAATTTTTTSSRDPWSYVGRHLKHLEFPLGGIGTGNILLQGDGCLRGWDVLNQFHSPKHRPLHNPPALDKGIASTESLANCWAIAATYDDDDDSEDSSSSTAPWPSLLLRSANHYGIRDESNNNKRRLGDPAKERPDRTEKSLPTQNDRPNYQHPRRPPSFPKISIRGRYPIAMVSYETPPSFPLSNIQLEAMTPMVPTNEDDSGYPMAVFVLTFTNPHPTKSVSVDVLQSTLNFIGWDGGKSGETDLATEDKNQNNSSRPLRTRSSPRMIPEKTASASATACKTYTATKNLPSCVWGGNLNEPFDYSTPPPEPPPINENSTERSYSSSSTRYSCKGLFLHTNNALKDDLIRKGSIALSAICKIKNSGRKDCGTAITDTAPTPTIRLIKGVSTEDELFHRFATRDFEEVDPKHKTPPSPNGATYAGAVIQSLSKIPPSSTATVTFCLSWHFPYRPCTSPRSNLPPDFYGNLYATRFSDAKEVAMRFCDSFSQTSDKTKKNLLEITRRFVESLYRSTIPWEILESACGRLAIPRSPTLFLTEAGVVLGNVGNDVGPLNATHVYGYTTLLERIFPGLARDMLSSVLVKNFDLRAGGCQVSFGEGGFAIDGGLACIAKVYLVVLQSDPGLDFLKAVWPNVKRQMEAVLSPKHLEPKTGLVRGPQQTTYGGLVNGANTLVGSYLLTALQATEAMSNLVGDVNFAKKCSKQFELSLQGYEQACWREDFGYYVADVDESNCRNSYGIGCCIDQLVATGLSRACGFGSVFDPDREARARKSIVRNNTVQSPAFEDEDSNLCFGDAGLRVCTYPHGKLGHGMPFSNEVASGLEYPLVAGLMGDGNWEDALRICSFLRSRQSGLRKSPWNEPELSGLYSARSMSGWNLFDQACGFSYDSIRASIGFAPKISFDSFSCFCTFHEGFGEFKQKTTDGDNDGKFSSGTITFTILYGSIELQTMRLETTAHVVDASLDGKTQEVSISADGVVDFGTKIVMREDSTLELKLSSPCNLGVFSKPEKRNFASFGFSPPANKRIAWHSTGKSRRTSQFLGVLVVAILIAYGWVILQCLLFPPNAAIGDFCSSCVSRKDCPTACNHRRYFYFGRSRP